MRLSTRTPRLGDIFYRVQASLVAGAPPIVVVHTITATYDKHYDMTIQLGCDSTGEPDEPEKISHTDFNVLPLHDTLREAAAAHVTNCFHAAHTAAKARQQMEALCEQTSANGAAAIQFLHAVDNDKATPEAR